MQNERVVRKKYQRNFLTNVILEIKIPKILELVKEKPPSDFQKKIVDYFPSINEFKGEFFKFTQRSMKQEKRTGWEFINKEKKMRIFFEPETIEIEFRKYSTFEDFIKIVKIVLDTLIGIYPIKIANELSLRYINQIYLKSGNPFKWNNYIKKSLFHFPKDFFNNQAKPLRYLNALEIKENEYNINFIYGIFNSEFPNQINRKEFTLDYKCFTKEDTEISDVIEITQQFHEILDKWFEMSILEGLRKKMGVEENEE